VAAQKAVVASAGVPDEAITSLPPALAAALTRKAEAEAAIAESKATLEALNLQNIKSGNDQNRVMVLSGPILDTDEAVAVLMRWSRRDPGQPITIYVNTPGGSVFDGNALVGCIRKLRAEGHKVTIHGAGTVMSYGAVLLQAADERVLDKDVVFMIHSAATGNSGIQGNIESVIDQTKMMQEVQERLLDALTERANITKARLKKMTARKELFLSAQEALKYGFCDRVE
jgi:ATP-dependent Clp protease protease subunit